MAGELSDFYHTLACADVHIMAMDVPCAACVRFSGAIHPLQAEIKSAYYEKSKLLHPDSTHDSTHDSTQQPDG